MTKASVRISFGPTEIVAAVPASEAAWAVADARRWLDEQFTVRECEPLRAMGKVLTVDKLLAVAEAIGAAGFQADPALRQAYALAAGALLARPQVHVDVGSRQIVY